MTPSLIDDLSCPAPFTPRSTAREVVTDGVMGGLSRGTLTREIVAGRRALRMTGDVRTENIGGFVQIALDLVTGGRPVDAREWATIVITACGPDEIYNLHLRTAALTRPWQSYRHSFVTGPDWRTFRLPFVAFAAHRTTAPLDLSTMRRIGLVAIGRAFLADLAIAEMHFSA